MKNRYKVVVSILLVIILGFIILFFFLKDEKVHVLKKYDPKTKRTTSIEFIIKNGDTILQGKYMYFNEQGNKISEGNFIDGHIKGKTINYYDNGKIESIVYHKNPEIIEEGTYYDRNGMIESYIMYDDFGKSSFIISFDEKGPKRFDGHTILEIYQYKFNHKNEFNTKTEQVLKVGDILKYKYLVAKIPNTTRSFKVENIDVDNSKVKRTIVEKIPVGVEVEEILTKKGINTIKAIVQYKFHDKVTPIINDTISFKVKVN
ncbi:hypothetical protein LNQ49_00945 [Flavobacterium sp. F-65]|jgi:hypothetical protein|uniref:MORN repeat variant n=1 Tax=Flavobacterium pisciphilum TaxID=2893755 RepID=A0ABS8MPX0_9FLAO|nr:hypothetical protein [Flavobacterium sp. F-65]MCC9070172.1 hypothetical protein [Flavobacterium sp. F-65]